MWCVASNNTMAISKRFAGIMDAMIWPILSSRRGKGWPSTAEGNMAETLFPPAPCRFARRSPISSDVNVDGRLWHSRRRRGQVRMGSLTGCFTVALPLLLQLPLTLSMPAANVACSVPSSMHRAKLGLSQYDLSQHDLSQTWIEPTWK